MTTSIIALLTGLSLLLWSAEIFIDGSSATARYYRMPPLLIGMLVVGFGTSAPEMIVSVLAAYKGNAGIAIGNAYGSNIANIGLILGASALIKPLSVHSSVLRKQLPVLCLTTILTIVLIFDLNLTRLDALILLLSFFGLMAWTIHTGLRNKEDNLANEISSVTAGGTINVKKAVFRLCWGLAILVISSRILVWGAVEISRILGVSDLIIGLTVVAVGTSLPEFASSVVAARKGEHDIAIGNIIGSNLFNTLAVVGMAGAVRPFAVGMETLTRDMVVMSCLTVLIFLLGYGFKGQQGRVSRFEGAALILAYAGYTAWLFAEAVV